MASQEQLNRALAELQLLERLISDLQARVMTLDSAVDEHERTLKLVEEIKKNGGSLSILIPIGAGSFVKGELVNVENIHVNVGAGVILVKSLDESQQLIIRRTEELRKLREETTKRLDEYVARAYELRQFLETVVARQQQGR
ncbi:MAG: prefoldin subunit alpha [Aigarchaeota archaeon]|nr:prefoldin subunit alpha [Candidatus Pelearchaeum maunauluense]